MIEFSLAHLTVLSLPPPEMVSVAFRTGYAQVGFRLLQVTPDTPGYPLMDNTPMLRETEARLGDTGISVFDIEFFRLSPDIDVASFEPAIAAGAELGARNLLAAPYVPDRSALIDRFGALCDLARPYGLNVNLEFYPWTVVANLADAVALVEAADRPNGGILVDTLHFDRSESTLEDLDRVPSRRLNYVQIADGPAAKPTTTEGLLHAARAERLPPGQGGIDILGILKRLPADLPIALEVPMETLTREVGPEEVALRVRQAASRLCAGLRSSGQ